MIVRPLRVYISGQITGMPRELARGLFNAAAVSVELCGHRPVNPFDIDNGDCDCPPGIKHTWECCLRKDIHVLIECDAIVMLTNWIRSRGATFERDIAVRLGMPVYLSVNDLPQVTSNAPGMHRQMSV
jgi:nucleoside 2-deoxyribosyltransferase